MQRLLTEEEYQELLNKIEFEKNKANEIIQKLCTEVANHKPVKFWGNKEALVWGCGIEDDEDAYCDECPVQDVCPEPYKRWSK